MCDFFWFSDSQRARIAPLLPADVHVRGKNRVDDRPVPSGIVHASYSRRPETCMIARSHSAASRPCRHPPNLSPAKAVTAGNCANGLKSAGPSPSSRHERPARSDITTIRPSKGSEISSSACSAASKTGGVSQLASSAAQNVMAAIYRARRSPHLVAIMSTLDRRPSSPWPAF